MVQKQKNRKLPIVAAITMFLLISTLSFAQTNTNVPTTSSTSQTTQNICNQFIPQSAIATIPSGVLPTTLLIILTMAIISAVVYAIGYAFNISSFVRFSKTEFVEIAITIVIVALLFGSFAALTPHGLVNPTDNRAVFVNDCSMLSTSSADVYTNLFTYFLIPNVELMLLTNFKFSIAPGNFGFTGIQPFAGYGLETSLLGTLVEFITFFATLLLALIAVLGIIFALFPLFLYIGIILRAVPWFRVAGGTFLALFIGFYLLFPVLLGAMMGAYTPIAPSITYFDKVISSLNQLSSSGIISGAATFSLTAIINIYKNISDVLGFNLLYVVIQSTVEPIIYTVFALVISLIISFDFTELLGDFLGSPSLSSKKTLNKVL